MKTEENFHIPVLLHEAVKYLINESLECQILADGTLGGGGYTKLICENIKPTDRVISIDKDLNALLYSENLLEDQKEKITFVNGNFGDLKDILIEIKIVVCLVLEV